MKSWWTTLLAAVAGALLALAGVTIAVLWGGVSARPEPPRIETAIARALRRAAIPAAARGAKNPLQATPETLAEARAHFADHCASCHANDGSGKTSLGQGLYPRVPDMRLAETQELTDGELFYIIENGIRLTGMPAWGTAAKQAETWKLVHFIRHLPSLTPEETLLMERLNPRSPEEWRELEEEERFLRGDEASGAPALPGRHGD
ncbi:MAG TPA: c-type cytochrome [Anaeromyxobacteraceae bacterium]|nr:c-type cytochrome [Anaeromyxobacteraceae bacterium]